MFQKPNQNAPVLSSVFLKKVGKLDYYILGSDFRSEALNFVARGMLEEPAVQTIQVAYEEVLEFIEMWMDECSTNGLTVFCYNEEDKRIAGGLFVKDNSIVPKQFNKFSSPESKKKLAPVMYNIGVLDHEAAKKFPKLNECSLGTVADLWMLAVDPIYKGQGISNVLFEFTLPLIKKAGFQYASIEATSFFTSKVAKRFGFSALCMMNMKECNWKGQKPFAKMKPPHGELTYWIKNLQEKNLREDSLDLERKEIIKHSKL